MQSLLGGLRYKRDILGDQAKGEKAYISIQVPRQATESKVTDLRN